MAYDSPRDERTDLEVVDGALGDTSVTRIIEVANVDDPNEDADDSDDLGEEVAEIVYLLLEGRLLRDLSGDRKVDIADGGSGSCGGDDGLSFAVDDSGSLSEKAESASALGERTNPPTEKSMLTISCLTAFSSLTVSVVLLTLCDSPVKSA